VYGITICLLATFLLLPAFVVDKNTKREQYINAYGGQLETGDIWGPPVYTLTRPTIYTVYWIVGIACLSVPFKGKASPKTLRFIHAGLTVLCLANWILLWIRVINANRHTLEDHTTTHVPAASKAIGSLIAFLPGCLMMSLKFQSPSAKKFD
jgi:hypothetical protein